MIIRSTFALRAATLAASMVLFAAANAASAGSGGHGGGAKSPALTGISGPVHGPGSSHNPIVYHPNHGPGSSHNPIMVAPTRDHRGPNGAPQGGVTVDGGAVKVTPAPTNCLRYCGGYRGGGGGGYGGRGGGGMRQPGFQGIVRDHRT